MKKLVLFIICFIFGLTACSNIGKTKDNHIHTYSDNWSSDDNYHWKSATCGHDVVEKFEHEFDEGVVWKEGYLTYTCSICGYQKWEQTDIFVWVSGEYVTFYQKILDEYVANNNKNYSIFVYGADTGYAPIAYENNPRKCADIFSVLQTDVGNILYDLGTLESTDLIDQIEQQNSNDIIKYCKSLSNGNYYLVPYMSQSLVLYYDKSLGVTEEDVSSIENLLAKAKELNKLAIGFGGYNCYNFSSFFLARPYNQKAIDAFGNSGTLKIYENNELNNCYAYGDDMVSIMKYANRFINDANGRNGAVVGMGMYQEMREKQIISYINGSWDYNTAKSIWGEGNVGVASLPTFTLTKEDEYGLAKEGMTFKSGAFTDFTCFVKNKYSPFSEELDDILLYLTNEVNSQKVYEEYSILPANMNIEIKEDDELSNAIIEMLNWGLPQPFGTIEHGVEYFYDKGADDVLVDIVQNKDHEYDDNAILNRLQIVSYIWANGVAPSSQEELNKWLNKN